MKQKGFTIIELLVVIAVIGLLASIVLVAVGPARKKARDARRQSDIRQINLAMEMCYDDANCGGAGSTWAEKYPDSSDGANDIDKIDTDSDPLYLDVPCDPSDKNCAGTGTYVYKWTDGTNQYYCVYAKLESPANANPTWVCASNKGVKVKEYAGPPSNDDCCGMSPAGGCVCSWAEGGGCVPACEPPEVCCVPSCCPGKSIRCAGDCSALPTE